MAEKVEMSKELKKALAAWAKKMGVGVEMTDWVKAKEGKNDPK